MNTLPTALLTAAGLSLMALATGATAQGTSAAVGTVLFAKGDVVIQATDGSQRAARRGDALGPGERLITGDGSIGQVRMNDGARLSVRPRSDVRLPQASAPGKPRVLQLRDGNIRVLNLAAETGSTHPYEVATPFGRMELANSDALAALGSPSEGGPRGAFVKLNAGRANAASGSGEILELVPGETASVGSAAITRLGPQAAAAAPIGTRLPGTAPAPSGERRGALPLAAPAGLGPLTALPVNRGIGPDFGTGTAASRATLPGSLGILPTSGGGGSIDPSRDFAGSTGPRVPPVQLSTAFRRTLPDVVVSGRGSTLTTQEQFRAVNVLGSVALGTDTTRLSLTSPTTTTSPTLTRTTTTTTTSTLIAPTFDTRTGTVTLESTRTGTTSLTGGTVLSGGTGGFVIRR